MALGLTVAVTMAVFTDKAKFTSAFSIGKVDIKVADDDPASTALAMILFGIPTGGVHVRVTHRVVEREPAGHGKVGGSDVPAWGSSWWIKRSNREWQEDPGY